MKKSDIDLELCEHIGCMHVWIYDCWEWSASGTKDIGFLHESPEGRPSDCKADNALLPATVGEMTEEDTDAIEKLNENLTRLTFSWCIGQVDSDFPKIISLRPTPGEEATVRGGATVFISKDEVQRWVKEVAQALC